MWLSFEDLFVVGIGFDIAGAYLLGRGLLVSPLEIARRATSYSGYSGPLTTSQIEDKADGSVGLAALVLGFLLQAAGYAVILGRVTTDRHGICVAITAVVLAVLAIGVVFALRKLARLPLMKREAVHVARMNVFTLPVEVEDRPYGRLLVLYGEEFGFKLRKGETDEEYAKRVFNVDEIEVGGPRSDPSPEPIKAPS